MIKFACDCQMKKHRAPLEGCEISSGAIYKLPEILKDYNRIYLVADKNTYRAAGELCEKVLRDAGKFSHKFILEGDIILPNVETLGKIILNANDPAAKADIFAYSPLPDLILAVGSGTVNDSCRVVSYRLGIPYGIVATAPSMDGFASASSSMERSGLKISLNSKCPEAVIADPEILVNAPKRMILSGIGDILAKYVSIVEWEIAHILVGDFYCETIADIVKDSLAQCVRDAKSAVNGDKRAILSVMEALVISGIAMNYAEISRPASGVEHYISHIVDMRALEWGTPSDFHGIQCAVATLTTVRAYEKLFSSEPDREKALAAVSAYDNDKWNAYLREKLGHGAESIIAGEVKEKKYDKADAKASAFPFSKEILKENKDVLDKLAMELLDKETLEEEKIYQILSNN